VGLSGTLSPGNSAGSLGMGSLTLQSGSTLEIELGGLVPGGEHDQLVVLGNTTLGGMLDVSLINPFTLTAGMNFTIVDIGGTSAGQFDGLSEGALVGNFGQELCITYQGGDGNDVELYTSGPIGGEFNGALPGSDLGASVG